MKTWRPTPQTAHILGSGLALVFRKHKSRQVTFGPGQSDVDELVAVVTGELEMMSAGVWRPAPPQTLGCFRRRTTYGIRQRAGYAGPVRIVNVLFRAPKEWASRLGRRPLILPGPWWRKFLDLEAACDFHDDGQRVLPLPQVLEFLQALAACAPAETSKPQPKRPDVNSEWLEIWARAEDVIRQRAAGGLTVSELAAAVFVSETQLRRIFLVTRGATPKAALTAWRIEQAKQKLASGRLSISQIAQAVGYSTVQRFSAAFRKETGRTPSAFARQSLSP